MHVKKFSILAALFALPMMPLMAHAQKGGAPQAGRFKDFHDVDQVTIVQPFVLNNYKRIAVQNIDTSGAPLPEAKDNSYPAVKAALAASTTSFTEGLRKKIGGNIAIENGRASGTDTLIIRARITKGDPGSQAARYFFSFGAGAVKVGMTGEVIDGKSGKTLVQFTQERRSGVGGFGGGYLELFDRTLRQIGGDVAGLLRAF